MGDGSGSVTLIFYRVGAKWWKEPALNLLAAAAQRSAYTHVELAIGEDALDDGSMTNVVRIFNDNVGVASCAVSNTWAIHFIASHTARRVRRKSQAARAATRSTRTSRSGAARMRSGGCSRLQSSKSASPFPMRAWRGRSSGRGKATIRPFSAQVISPLASPPSGTCSRS